MHQDAPLKSPMCNSWTISRSVKLNSSAFPFANLQLLLLVCHYFCMADFEYLIDTKFLKQSSALKVKLWHVACFMWSYVWVHRERLSTREYMWALLNVLCQWNFLFFSFVLSLFQSTCVLGMFHVGGVFTDGNLIWNTCPVFEPSSAPPADHGKKLATLKQMTID